MNCGFPCAGDRGLSDGRGPVLAGWLAEVLRLDDEGGVMFPDPDAVAVQVAVCDRYRDLACAVLHLSVLDARQTSLPESFRLDARLFLMEPAGAWLMALLDLDPEETRRRALADWMAREGTRHNTSRKGSGSNGTNG